MILTGATSTEETGGTDHAEPGVFLGLLDGDAREGVGVQEAPEQAARSGGSHGSLQSEQRVYV